MTREEAVSVAPPSPWLWRALRADASSALGGQDRWAISDLVQTYALAVDDCDVETIVDMFTLDGSFLRAGRTVQGRAALTEFFTQMAAVYRTTLHTPQSLVVVADGDERARGVATGEAELVMPDGEVVVAAYRYADRYRRDDDVWRFESRELAFRHALPVTEYAGGMGDAVRIRRPGAEPAVAQLPENYTTWRAAHPSLAEHETKRI